MTQANSLHGFFKVVYEEEFPKNSVIIGPSTYFGQFVIDHSKLQLNLSLCKGQYFLVYGESTGETTHGGYVVPVLMDADYPDEPFYSVFNTLDEPLVLTKVSFIVYVCSKESLEKSAHYVQHFKFPLICQTEDNDSTWDKIIELRRSSRHANGLDLVFDESSGREYKIESKGELILKVQWAKSFGDFSKASPSLIMPRSSFARLGLTVRLLESGEIVMRNNSSKRLELGGRFVQLVLPPCFSFAINKPLVDKLAVNCVFTSIESMLKSNERKPKKILYK